MASAVASLRGNIIENVEELNDRIECMARGVVGQDRLVDAWLTVDTLERSTEHWREKDPGAVERVVLVMEEYEEVFGKVKRDFAALRDTCANYLLDDDSWTLAKSKKGVRTWFRSRCLLRHLLHCSLGPFFLLGKSPVNQPLASKWRVLSMRLCSM